MEKKTKKTEQKENVVGTRGRTFQGTVVKKFDTRVVVEFQRTVRIPKYDRFARKKTKLHARIPEGMTIHAGDYVEVRECRPLSKIIRFVVTKIVKEADKQEEKK